MKWEDSPPKEEEREARRRPCDGGKMEITRSFSAFGLGVRVSEGWGGCTLQVLAVLASTLMIENRRKERQSSVHIITYYGILINTHIYFNNIRIYYKLQKYTQIYTRYTLIYNNIPRDPDSPM